MAASMANTRLFRLPLSHYPARPTLLQHTGRTIVTQRSKVLAPRHALAEITGVPGTISEQDSAKYIALLQRFQMADTDGNGSIDREELRYLLESMESGETYLMTQHWLPDEELDKAMRMYDKNKDGVISFDEFKQLAFDGILLDGKLSEYEEAFKAVDTSGNGTIGANELAQVFQRLGQPLSFERLVEIFQKYDKDESGQIEFNEFLLMFRDSLLDLKAMKRYMALGSEMASGSGSGGVIDAMEGDISLIFSEKELDEILASNKDKITVLFNALTWCRPCKAMVRPVQKLAEAYKGSVSFVKLFGNSNNQTKLLFKDRLQVRSTPCFIFFKNGEIIFTQTGASKEKLEAAIRDLLPPSQVPMISLFKPA